ncbi:MAG: peptide chain release factor N(5)-glutamine methyltransferase [Acidimicrobiia bacterium]|nr:peptide chain release factor N(5)-glutamine methyltransferase [Acidimicrobiia bacterium]
MGHTSSELLQEARDLPEHEASRLLLAAASAERSWLVGDPAVTVDVANRFREYAERRRTGEPLQYIEGTVQFGPIEVAVDRRVLIPRPETEQLYEAAVERLRGITSPVVVDLCSGSGNLALAIKHALPAARVIASDLSPDAVAVAAENAARLDLDIELVTGDLFSALPAEVAGSVDLIVTNPPYVTRDECALLPEEIADWEPALALNGGADGLDSLRRVAAEAADWLRPGGWLLCEIGERHGSVAERLFAAFRPEITRDLAGRDRFLLGRAPMPDELH